MLFSVEQYLISQKKTFKTRNTYIKGSKRAKQYNNSNTNTGLILIAFTGNILKL